MGWSKVSRHQRGYGTAHDKMRAHLLATVITCEGECKAKGIETLGTIADHIVPLSRGGTGDRSNYQLLCRPCSEPRRSLTRAQRLDRSVASGVMAGRPARTIHGTGDENGTG